jgi:uncharacterized protein (DUF1786 family)
MSDLTIEYHRDSILRHAPLRERLVAAVEAASDLHDALRRIEAIPLLTVSRSGDAVEVFESVAGGLGTVRLAVVTDGAGTRPARTEAKS